MIIIQETDKVFIVFFKKEIFLDTNTVSISTSLRGTELLWHQNLFFSMSISRNVKISLPIFIRENKLFMFYNVPLVLVK